MSDKKDWPKVAIIVLNWNGWRDTIECLESLQRLTYPNYQIIIVDNGSTDGSVEQIKTWAAQKYQLVSSALQLEEQRIVEKMVARVYVYAERDQALAIKKCPFLIIIELSSNLGYAGGNNVGIKYAVNSGSEYCILVNNDVRIHDPAIIEYLVGIAQSNPKIAVLGPKIVGPDGRFLHGAGWVSRWGRLKTRDSDTPVQCDFVTGAFFVMRLSCIQQIGMLDESYFLYWEETDFCRRVRRHGYDVYYVPQTKVIHLESTSANSVKTYYMARNWVRYVRSSGEVSEIGLVCVTVGLACFKTGVILAGGLLRRRPAVLRRIRDIWEGYLEGLRGVQGKRAEKGMR